MSNTQALKTRIRSVKSTKQITKAMQLVAASKMRRAQEATKASAPYTEAARELLAHLASHTSVKGHPLFAQRPVATRLLITIASDKGLAGAFNSNLTRLYANELIADDKNGIKNTTITIGRKAAQFVARIKDTQVLGSYQDLADRPDGNELRAILDTARELFTSGKVDAVDLVYTEYVSSVIQRAKVERVLPAGFSAAADAEAAASQDVTYEPSTEEVLDGVAYRLVSAQLYQALLESRASEYSMRMMAMKNATDNASDLVDDLTLEMNKARQSAITQELSEISGGVEALND
jgi:F-type H+-transporting ATPase subunit gamma